MMAELMNLAKTTVASRRCAYREIWGWLRNRTVRTAMGSVLFGKLGEL